MFAVSVADPGVSSIFSPLVTGSTDMLGGPTASVVPSSKHSIDTCDVLCTCNCFRYTSLYWL